MMTFMNLIIFASATQMQPRYSSCRGSLKQLRWTGYGWRMVGLIALLVILSTVVGIEERDDLKAHSREMEKRLEEFQQKVCSIVL